MIFTSAMALIIKIDSLADPNVAQVDIFFDVCHRST